MRGRNVTEQAPDLVVSAFVENMSGLTEVWASMMWLTTANSGVVGVRREIARWARNTNQAFMDTFGRATASEEIRVILEGLVSLVPNQVGDDGRAFLSRLTAEARELATRANTAVAAV